MGKRRRKRVHAKDRGPSAPIFSLVWNSSNCHQFLLGDSECLIDDVTFLLLFVLLLGSFARLRGHSALPRTLELQLVASQGLSQSIFWMLMCP